MNDTILKHSSLVLLALQNLGFGLLLPLCRKPDADGNVFFAPMGVVMMEVLKMCVAYAGLTWKHYSAQQQRQRDGAQVYEPILADEKAERTPDSYTVDIKTELDTTATRVYSAPTGTLQDCVRLAFGECWHAGALRMAVPSLLYVVQNNLQIFSAGFLSPAEFQVFSQMKLITTAVFLVLLLNRKLTAQHWMCIVALCFGIVLVKGADDLLSGFKAAGGAHINRAVWAVGFPAIMGASVCSGLAGVYIEMQLKNSNQCFWASNVQLAAFSLLPAMVPVVLDGYQRHAFDPFRHFTPLVWAMILVNVAGGILVATVIKYADNILKGFAVSVSLISTIFVSSWLTGAPLTAYQLVGALVVAASTFVYGQTKVPKE